MSFTKRKTRITARRVAEIFGCSPKTVYNDGAGTEQLTRVRNGSRQIRFLLEEVLPSSKNNAGTQNLNDLSR